MYKHIILQHSSLKQKVSRILALCCTAVFFCTAVHAMNTTSSVIGCSYPIINGKRFYVDEHEYDHLDSLPDPDTTSASPSTNTTTANRRDLFSTDIRIDHKTGQPRVENKDLPAIERKEEEEDTWDEDHASTINFAKQQKEKFTRELQDPSLHYMKDLHERLIQNHDATIQKYEQDRETHRKDREKRINDEAAKYQQKVAERAQLRQTRLRKAIHCLEQRRQALTPYLTSRLAKAQASIDSNTGKNFWYNLLVMIAELLDYTVKYYRIVRMQKSTDAQELKRLGYLSAATGALVAGAKTSLGGLQGLFYALPNILDLVYGLRLAKQSKKLAKYNDMRSPNKKLYYLLLALQTVETGSSLCFGRASSLFRLNANTKNVTGSFATFKATTEKLSFFAPGSYFGRNAIIRDTDSSLCKLEGSIAATPASLTVLCAWLIRYITENIALSKLTKHPHAAILNAPDLESYENDSSTNTTPQTTLES